MTTFKLFYFNVTGLAEPVRYLLSYCGIPFQDIRLNYIEEWIPKYKKDMPMEQLPVLEIDGVKFHQHLSICRYIARKNKLCGSNEEQAYEMDAIADDINDIRLQVGMWYKENESELKVKLKEEATEGLAFYLSRFESITKKNDGFFVGKKVSWVDIYYAATTESMSKLLKQDLNKDYPNLRNLSYRIRSHMMIAPYIQARPESDI